MIEKKRGRDREGKRGGRLREEKREWGVGIWYH